jgi:hypothetical protein
MSLKHVVVDGSNIATEGRTAPSLAQLDDAVRTFIEEYGADRLTVVVDATFGHRIDESERAAYEEAVLAGEVVSPPAGAIGRGDAFVLQIADKAGATVFSNDSFQEFHGDYDWLFDEGRLIGGKPVPEVGWVFVARTPVRGPTSRRATAGVKRTRKGRSASSAPRAAAASAKQVTAAINAQRGGAAPKIGDSLAVAPEPAKAGRRSSSSPSKRKAAAATAPAPAPTTSPGPGRNRRSTGTREPANQPLPFIEFVGSHPVGSAVTAEVERFSSHGAYVRVDDLLCYVPLKSMGDPAPRRARDVLTIGEAREFIVQRFDPPHRGVDLALRGYEVLTDTALSADEVPDQDNPVEEAPDMAAPAKKTAAKKTAAKKAPAKKTAAKKAPAKKTAAKKAPARKAPAKKAPARKAPAKKAPAKKTTARKAPARKAPAKKAPAKKATARKAPARKAPAKKTTARKAPAKKTTAKKAPAKKR